MLARASCHVDYKKFYMTCQEYEIILVEDTPPPQNNSLKNSFMYNV